MSSVSKGIFPVIVLQNEEIKKCEGCLVLSQNRVGRSSARRCMQRYDESYNNKPGVVRCFVSVKDLGYDDWNKHQFKIHVRVEHQDDHSLCSNYSREIVSRIFELKDS